MVKEKKLSLEQLIEKTDAAKKANPLDLSSDQDLTIALMNLTSLEEHFFFSGGKTGKTGFYDLINIVREMRKELMDRVVKKSGGDHGEVWCISKHLLAASMRLMEVGTKALGAGKKEDAYNMFNKAYELYSLFWGINMDLIDLTGTQKVGDKLPHGLDIWVNDVKTDRKTEKSTPVVATASKSKQAENKSVTSRLGAWVKNAVNCCLE
ncbi:MAG: hypothetical protein FWG80_01785 [Alphaproteobacteria bacterium]|nr:hypothetical protein [Alphaproteobacteria bacterium]